MEETFHRKTVSFYRYVNIENPSQKRDDLYKMWSDLNCFGRIYVASEGINAQMSVPEHNWDEFVKQLYADQNFTNVPFKMAVDNNGKSFYKLIVKVRDKIVADGINDPNFNPSNTGHYLNAIEFNKAIEDPETIVVDMRNHYESEVGHFDRAFCPDADTFREELPLVVEHLKGKEDKKVIMYCTGGIRCEKATAFLLENGFKEVYHLHGGIIEYGKQTGGKDFEGKCYVFDERITVDVNEVNPTLISHCLRCGTLSARMVNCANPECNNHFAMCEECGWKYDGTCSNSCQQHPRKRTYDGSGYYVKGKVL